MVKRKLCYMDTDTFLVYIKTNDVYKDIPKVLELDLILHIIN